MYLKSNNTEVVFCKVGPDHVNHGKRFPVWTLYDNGNWRRVFRNAVTVGRPLRKPLGQFTLDDLEGIVEGNEKPY